MNWIQTLFNGNCQPNSTASEFKEVKIQMRWSSFDEDIIETDTVKVPVGLTEWEENKFIDAYVYDNWHFAHGY